MMRAKGLCRGCADLYRAWAYYYEAAGDFQSANNVFEDGKRVLAQPYEELENAHQNLIMAAGQHVNIQKKFSVTSKAAILFSGLIRTRREPINGETSSLNLPTYLQVRQGRFCEGSER